MKNIQIIIEILWLVIAATCFGCAVYLLVKISYDAEKIRITFFFILGIISVFMSFIRRMQRKNKEKRESIFKKKI